MSNDWIGIVDIAEGEEEEGSDIYFSASKDKIHWFSSYRIRPSVQSLAKTVSYKSKEVTRVLAPKELSYWSKEDEIT
jgi:adenylate cyclase class IV